MKLRSTLLLLFAASPLAGQGPSIAPAPSALFRSAVIDTSSDTVKVDTGIPQAAGRMIGLVAGSAVGYVIGDLIRTKNSCVGVSASEEGCRGAGNAGDRVIPATIFGLIGFFVGGALTGAHAPDQ